MKILQVITKGEIGGAQQVVLGLAKGLKKEGHEITIGLGDGQYLRDKAEKGGIATVDFNYLKRSANPLSGLLFILEIKKFLAKEKFDVIHFHSSNALIGALGAKLSKNKLKTIFTFHGLSMLDPNYETNFLLRALYWLYFKFFLHFIDKKIFVCNYNLEIAKKIKLVNSGEVIYNSIDESELNFLPREEARRMLSEKCGIDLSGKFVIGSIGRLAYQKNYEFLINLFPEILKICPEAKVILVGSGPEKEKYQSFIEGKKLEDKIFLAGDIFDASRLLKGFDLFVLPSRYEGLSISLLEAETAGMPIIASRVGGNPEILANKNLYEFDDIKDFIEKFKKNHQLLGDNYPFLNKVTLEAVAKEYLDVYA